MDSKNTGIIYGINGPVIYLKGKSSFKMSEMVYVGKEKLVGEVISLDKDQTTIQVYEETSGLRPGLPTFVHQISTRLGASSPTKARQVILARRTYVT